MKPAIGSTNSAPSPRVTAQFDRAARVYEPQEQLSIRYQVGGIDEATIRAVERSVLWYTEGKGEEDLGVHFFERIDGSERLAEAVPDGAFVVRLPTSPLSYEGVIVKVRWCVRVRIFFASGRDFVSEHVFDLGHIPPARGILPPLDTPEP
ncbi:MAG: hypothetical protein WCJ18_07230 [Planctomycetota bacterium]